MDENEFSTKILSRCAYTFHLLLSLWLRSERLKHFTNYLMQDMKYIINFKIKYKINFFLLLVGGIR